MDTDVVRELVSGATRLAAQHGYRRTKCPMCQGQGVARISDANAPDGWKVLDPCPNCDGVGALWFVGNETLEFARRRSGGLISASELIARWAPPGDGIGVEDVG